MLVVISLGRAALLGGGDPPGFEARGGHVASTARVIGDIARHHRVVLTHAIGPQVGLLGLQGALGSREAHGYTLDVLGAGAEGLVGYLLQQALANELRDQEIVTVLTQVVVDPEDPAFRSPAKAVGPPLAEEDAGRLVAERGWKVTPTPEGLRRVVPSPEPYAVVELRTIRRLVTAGVLVVCGGPGIPVAVDADGTLRGVEAVIDTDRSAALVATLLGADVLLLLTDVPAVIGGWGTDSPHPLHEVTPEVLRSMTFDNATMAPKVRAACRFVEATGRRSAIGAVADAPMLLAREVGTQVEAAANGHDRPGALLLGGSQGWPWEP